MSAVRTNGHWEERFSRELSLAAVSRWSLGLAFNSWMYRLRGDVFLPAVRRFRRPDEATRVIEVGPGTGFYVELWQRLGIRHLSALDFSSTAVATLSERHPEYEFRQCDITCGLPDELIGNGDIVTAIDVIDAKFMFRRNLGKMQLQLRDYLTAGNFLFFCAPQCLFRIFIRRKWEMRGH